MNRQLTKSNAPRHLVATLCLALALPLLAGCQESPEQHEVDLFLDDLSQALAERDVRGLLRHTTHDFMLLPGRLDKAGAAKRAFLMFKLHGPVEALYPRPAIAIDAAGDARVSGPLLLVRAGAGDADLEQLEDDPAAWLDLAEELGEVITADLSLVKQGDRWLVQTARFF